MAINLTEIYTSVGADTNPLVESRKKVDKITKDMTSTLLGVTKNGEKMLSKVGTKGVTVAESKVDKSSKEIIDDLNKVSKKGKSVLDKLNTSGIDKAEKKVSAFVGKVKSGFDKISNFSFKANQIIDFTKSIAAMGKAIFNAGEAILDFVTKQSQADDKLQKLGIRLGVSTEELSRYTHVTNLSGIEFTKFTTGLERMQSEIGKSAIEMEEAEDEFEKFKETAKAAKQEKIDEYFEKLSTKQTKLTENGKLSTKALQEIADAQEEVKKKAADKYFDSIEKAQKKMENAGGNLASALNTLGVEINDLIGLNAIEQFEYLAEALFEIEDSNRQAALAAEIFGRRNIELLQAIKGGPEAIKQMKDEADILGVTLGQNVADEAANLNDMLARMYSSFKAVTANLARDAYPAFTSAAEAIMRIGVEIAKWVVGNKELIQSTINDWIEKFIVNLEGAVDYVTKNKDTIIEYASTIKDKFVTAVQVGVDVIGSLVDILSPLLSVFNSMPQGLKTASVAFIGLSTVLGPLILTVSSVVLSVISFSKESSILITGITKLSGLFTSVSSVLSGVVTAAFSSIVITFAAVAAAIISVGAAVYQLIKHWDDVKATTEALVVALKYKFKDLYLQVKIYVKKIYDSAKDYLVDKFKSIKSSVVDFVTYTINYWKQMPNKIISYAKSIYEGAKLWLVDKFNSVVNWLRDKLEAIIQAFKTAGNALVFNSIVPDMIDEIGYEFNRLDEVMVKPTEKYTSDLIRIYDKAAKKIKNVNIIPDARDYYNLADIIALTRGVNVTDIDEVGDVGLSNLRKELEETQNFTLFFVSEMSSYFDDFTNNVLESINDLKTNGTESFGDLFNNIENLINTFSYILGNIFTDLSNSTENSLVNIDGSINIHFTSMISNTTSYMETIKTAIEEGFGDSVVLAEAAMVDLNISVSGHMDTLSSNIETKVLDINGILSLIASDTGQYIQQNLYNITGEGGPFDEFVTSLVTIVGEISNVLSLVGEDFEDSFETAVDNIISYFATNFSSGIEDEMDDFIIAWNSKLGSNMTTPSTLKGDWGLAVSSMVTYFGEQFNTGTPSVNSEMTTFLSSWSDFSNAIMYAWEAALSYVATGSYSGGGMVQGYEVGGRVTGPEGVDKVPAWLTAGEYVIPEPSVKYYGEEFLDAIRTRKYMDGGIIPELQKPFTNIYDFPFSGTFLSIGAPAVREVSDEYYDSSGQVLLDSKGYGIWKYNQVDINPNSPGSFNQTEIPIAQWEWFLGSTPGVWTGDTSWLNMHVNSDILAPLGWYANYFLTDQSGGYTSPPYRMGNFEYFTKDQTLTKYKDGQLWTYTSGPVWPAIFETYGPKAAASHTKLWPNFYDYLDTMGISRDPNEWLVPNLNYHEGGETPGGLINTLPGEVVIKPSSVNKYGKDMLGEINRGEYEENSPLTVIIHVEGNIIDNPTMDKKFIERVSEGLEKLEGRRRWQNR